MDDMLVFTNLLNILSMSSYPLKVFEWSLNGTQSPVLRPLSDKNGIQYPKLDTIAVHFAYGLSCQNRSAWNDWFLLKQSQSPLTP